MNHRDTEITEAIIGAAIEVHRNLGPGVLESIYETCLEFELKAAGHKVERQKTLPVVYKSLSFDDGFRLDLLVDDRIIVELKCVESILPIHEAQVISYLKMTQLNTGLLLNFKVPVLKQGIKRLSI